MKSKAVATLSVVLAVSLLVACGSETPEKLLSQARESLAKNDTSAAVIHIKNALQAEPNSGEGRYLLGVALLEGGNSVSAEVELRKAESLHYKPDLVVPRLAALMLSQGQYKKLTDEFAATELGAPAAKADLRTSLAYAFAAQGQPDAARSSLQSALAVAPDYVPAQLAQIRLQATSGDLEGARTAATRLVEHNPQSAEAWQLRGDLSASLRDVDSALADYRHALTVKPALAPARASLVTLLLQQGKSDEADGQLAELRKVSGNNTQSKYLEALIAASRRDFGKSRELAQQLVKVAPDNEAILVLAGSAELQAGSLQQAETFLSHALQLNPQSLAARRLLVNTFQRASRPDRALSVLTANGEVPPAMYSVAGEVYLQTGDAKKAESYFARAASLDPGDKRKRTALALARLKGGEQAVAVAELKDIASSDEGTSADMALVSTYMTAGDFPRALQAISALEKKRPQDPLAPYLRGRVQLANHQTAEARASFERAMALAPDHLQAAASLSALDFAEGKVGEARARLDTFSDKYPKNSAALVARAQLASLSGVGKEGVPDLLQKAVASEPAETAPRLFLIEYYLSMRKPALALQVAQAASVALPDRPEILDALGRAQQASGNINQAIATFTKLAALTPESPLPELRLADVHMASDNKSAALESLRSALNIKPDSVEAQRRLVMLEVADNNYRAALETARSAQRQMPKQAIGFLLEGDVSALQREWANAIRAYRMGLALTPSSELAVKLHGVLLASGDITEAAKFSTLWIKDHADDAAFLFHLGDVALRSNDWPAAERAYAAVIRLQPSSAMAYNNLAWVANQQKKQVALEYAEKANRLANDEPEFLDTWATILADAKQFDKAIDVQKKAVALKPDSATLKLSLAKLYLKAGNKANARVELDQLASLGPKFAGQAEVATILKSL